MEMEEEDLPPPLSRSNVQFTLGGGEETPAISGGDNTKRYPLSMYRQNSDLMNRQPTITSARVSKSYSEDFGESIDQEIEKQLAKIQASQSETYLESAQNANQRHQNQRKPRRPLPPTKLGELRKPGSYSNNGPTFSSMSSNPSAANTPPEEDTSHSTDSGSIPGDPEVEDLKKNTRKHRIHFPKFTKKTIRLSSSSSNPKIQPT
uniref:Uncharacterized protein n=2 Tax=Cacopsylla melanoneura TaxID=428564 RepID=A0A8D9AUL1_9HEMI